MSYLVSIFVTVGGRRQRGLHQPEDLEETVQRVVAVQLGGIRGRERNTIRTRQLDDSLRTHGALDVTVELHLGQGVESGAKGRHPRIVAVPSMAEPSPDWVGTRPRRSNALAESCAFPPEPGGSDDALQSHEERHTAAHAAASVTGPMR